MKRFKAGVVCLLILLLAVSVFAQGAETKTTEGWWEGHWQWPKPNPEKTVLPLIRVAGNVFVNANNDTILFRGLAIGDPDKLEHQGHWSKQHFEKVKEMGATLVRIPIHPIAWRSRTPDAYLKLLDEAVSWCTGLELYIIIDWHSIGNLGMEIFQHKMYDTTQKETFEFWRTIASHFRGHNTVAFYEIFNEPALSQGRFGNMSWDEWKTLNEKIIKLIRAYDPDPIPLVAGFDWAYNLNQVHFNPIDADRIGYVTHPYPMKRKPPWPEKWEEDFGFVANQYPMIATEIGFGVRKGDVIDENHYGNIITHYLESRGISWIAWVFDADWHPKLIESWNTYQLTEPGEFFKEAMQREIQK